MQNDQTIRAQWTFDYDHKKNAWVYSTWDRETLRLPARYQVRRVLPQEAIEVGLKKLLSEATDTSALFQNRAVTRLLEIPDEKTRPRENKKQVANEVAPKP